MSLFPQISPSKTRRRKSQKGKPKKKKKKRGVLPLISISTRGFVTSPKRKKRQKIKNNSSSRNGSFFGGPTLLNFEYGKTRRRSRSDVDPPKQEIVGEVGEVENDSPRSMSQENYREDMQRSRKRKTSSGNTGARKRASSSSSKENIYMEELLPKKKERKRSLRKQKEEYLRKLHVNVKEGAGRSAGAKKVSPTKRRSPDRISPTKKRSPDRISPTKRRSPDRISPTKRRSPDRISPTKRRSPDRISPTKRRSPDRLSPTKKREGKSYAKVLSPVDKRSPTKRMKGDFENVSNRSPVKRKSPSRRRLGEFGGVNSRSPVKGISPVTSWRQREFDSLGLEAKTKKGKGKLTSEEKLRMKQKSNEEKEREMFEKDRVLRQKKKKRKSREKKSKEEKRKREEKRKSRDMSTPAILISPSSTDQNFQKKRKEKFEKSQKNWKSEKTESGHKIPSKPANQVSKKKRVGKKAAEKGNSGKQATSKGILAEKQVHKLKTQRSFNLKTGKTLRVKRKRILIIKYFPDKYFAMSQGDDRFVNLYGSFNGWRGGQKMMFSRKQNFYYSFVKALSGKTVSFDFEEMNLTRRRKKRVMIRSSSILKKTGYTLKSRKGKSGRCNQFSVPLFSSFEKGPCIADLFYNGNDEIGAQSTLSHLNNMYSPNKKKIEKSIKQSLLLNRALGNARKQKVQKSDVPNFKLASRSRSRTMTSEMMKAARSNSCTNRKFKNKPVCATTALRQERERLIKANGLSERYKLGKPLRYRFFGVKLELQENDNEYGQECKKFLGEDKRTPKVPAACPPFLNEWLPSIPSREADFRDRQPKNFLKSNPFGHVVINRLFFEVSGEKEMEKKKLDVKGKDRKSSKHKTYSKAKGKKSENVLRNVRAVSLVAKSTWKVNGQRKDMTTNIYFFTNTTQGHRSWIVSSTNS